MSVHPQLLHTQSANGTVAKCTIGHEAHGATLWEAGANLDDVCRTADLLAAGTETYAWPMPAWDGDHE